ncbi:FliG C-terminal domain-containing protein [Buchnera aphidicola (Chaitoregma tattakana)]|uniref:FliG C-terminal domain-containing protein n=1 Tax=Buchnera aphidicola TaxID=9 RepID=UPI0031B82E36
MNNSINGYTKSACLLFYLGIKKSIKILKFLTKTEKNKIICKLSDPSILSKENIDSAIESYKKCYKNEILRKKDSFKNYFNIILSKFFNKKERYYFINEINTKKVFLKNVKRVNLNSSKNCYIVLRGEHPQIIAAFLKYVDHRKSMKILSFFNKKDRNEILRRMFEIQSMNQFSKNEFFKIINDVFKKEKSHKLNTFDKAINVFKLFTKKDKVYILKNFFKNNSNIKKEIICLMFSFEDIFFLKNCSISILLKYVDKKVLYISMLDLSEKFKKIFLMNMSKKQLNYFFHMFQKENFSSSPISIKCSKDKILKTLQLLLKKDVLILKDLEKIYV